MLSSIYILFFSSYFISSYAFELPITRNVNRLLMKRGDVSGDIGLGNNADLLYTVPVEVGDDATAVHLDTGSSDLWVITDACRGGTCDMANAARYASASLNSSGTDVAMYYGDSTTGTNATGEIAFETVTVAGIAIEHQTFAAVDFTTNPTVKYNAAGIFGLGFPSGSKVQESIVIDRAGPLTTTDAFVDSTHQYGPTLARIAETGALTMPMFSISLQRNTIDIGGGTGKLTVGSLPEGVDNSSLTWVPVRLYSAKEGGLRPPTFAPNEVYPFRWEIDIEAVFLDGQRVADSTIPARGGVDGTRNSGLLDTGNSLLRGPQDVVANIMRTVSGRVDKVMPCAIPRTLSFQIGGKIFPIDPRDFIGQHVPGSVETCVADNLVPTDPPHVGALFRWSLGDPFFKSNLVAFHYGNLTHPSVDPPRIGILSMVPQNANEVYRQAVQDAINNGGNFETKLDIAPTAQVAAEGATTVRPTTQIITRTVSLGGSSTTTPVNSDTDDGAANEEEENAAVRIRTLGAAGLVQMFLAWSLGSMCLSFMGFV